MNKKLTTILLAVLIILIGKVDAATLTQKIGEGYIRSTVVEGQEVTIKFVSSKYTFSNWTVESGNISIDTTNPIITFTMPSSNVIIKANYIAATKYNCACSGCGNTVSASGLWCDSCTTAGICSDCSKCVTHNTSLCTTCNLCSNCCTCVENYTLTYNANGGSGAPESQTGTTLTISSVTPTRSGYTFVGWSESSSATTATYVVGGTITLTSNKTLYAIWTCSHANTYSEDGGVTVYSCTSTMVYCSDCGSYLSSWNGSAHTYENSVCTNCGYECIEHDWTHLTSSDSDWWLKCECSNCGTRKDHEWYEKTIASSQCSDCGISCIHTYAETCIGGVCETCNRQLNYTSHFYNGYANCRRCGYECQHTGEWGQGDMYSGITGECISRTCADCGTFDCGNDAAHSYSTGNCTTSSCSICGYSARSEHIGSPCILCGTTE